MIDGSIKIAHNWTETTLGSVIALSNGKSMTAKQMAEGKPFPVYGSSTVLGHADKALVFEDTLVIGRVGACGRVQIAKAPCWISDNAMYVSRIDARVNTEFLFYLLNHLDLGQLAGRTSQPSLPQSPILSRKILLPPVPIQERIVHILQKADEIRSKQRDALELAHAILSASFISMFGDPSRNHDDFKRVPLGDLADVRSGVTKGRKLKGKETVEVPYLRVANVQDGFLDLDEIRTIEVLPGDVEKYHLEDGDILMIEGCGNPSYLGRGTIWRNEIAGCIHQNHVFRARVNRTKLLPEYLAALLRTRYANSYFLSCAKTSSGLANINSTQVKAFPIPLPTIDLQKKFVMAGEQWESVADNLKQAQADADAAFLSLMAGAFTGELTSEWEAQNQEFIAEQVKFHERLPQLILLALLQEKASREGGKKAQAALFVTALMKYVFLLQIEGSARRRFYQFVPYHYGPFAKELYTDLENLQSAGLVNVDNDSDEDKTRITITDPEKVVNALADIPEDRKEDVASIREDIASILDLYGDLDHNALLKAVYEKYPAYAKKSRLKKWNRT